MKKSSPKMSELEFLRNYQAILNDKNKLDEAVSLRDRSINYSLSELDERKAFNERGEQVHVVDKNRMSVHADKAPLLEQKIAELDKEAKIVNLAIGSLATGTMSFLLGSGLMIAGGVMLATGVGIPVGIALIACGGLATIGGIGMGIYAVTRSFSISADSKTQPEQQA